MAAPCNSGGLVRGRVVAQNVGGVSSVASLSPPMPPQSPALPLLQPGRRIAARGALRWLCLAATAASAPASPAGPVAAGAPRVEVWIELQAPPPRAGADAAACAAALREIDAQQAALTSALLPLGGVERGRVRLVLNAMAAELPASAVAAARALPFVKGVRVVQNRMLIDDGPR
jgi:hypothetical protein